MTADIGDGAQAVEPPDVTGLREQRRSLKRLTRDLMMWTGLLRHKAMSLRSLGSRISSGLPAGLVPGSLDPRALADELAASLARGRTDAPPPRSEKVESTDGEEAIEQARALWETVVDPSDAQACERLSDAADALAAQLEVLVNEALDQYRKLGDELVRALHVAKHPRSGRAQDA